MPGPRRITSRIHGLSAPILSKPRVDHSSNSEDHDGSPVASMLTPPKHAHIPDTPTDSNLVFEAMVLVFSLISMCMQYINLYKTVWWLPQSHAKYSLNFYLIDPYVVLSLVVLFSLRFIWCFVKEVYTGKSQGSVLYWLVQLFKLVLILAAMALFLWTEYQTFLRYSFSYFLTLWYPLVFYILLFSLSAGSFFKRLSSGNNGKTNGQASIDGKSTPKHKPRENGTLTHICSMSPEAVREEVDVLKTDFNSRIKRVLFSSMMVAYYMGFIPLYFAQNTLHYDMWWAGQHICLIWITAFIFFMVHYLPPKHLDLLHRCSLHLGRWVKVEGRHAHVPYNAWSELQVWQQGALVKHVKGLFKAEGVNNSAEPGNSMHSRFYFMFSQPLRVINWLLILTLTLVAFQFFCLVQSTEWCHITTLAFLLFSNYYSFFKLMRDRLVLTKCYKEEQGLVQ